jgi:AcrR family transcriptional regulator
MRAFARILNSRFWSLAAMPVRARRVRTQPRKAPRQARSKATVDAILAAAARVLVKDGFERTTTNRVADAAGVSIGSLYQYFPSKESLVAALVTAHVDEMRGLVLAALEEVRVLPLRPAARRMIELLVAAHAVDPGLHRVLMEQVPRTGRLGKLADFEADLHRLIVAWLEMHRAELRVTDLGLAAFLAAATVEAITHFSVLYQPERLRDPTFLDEATELIVRYLGRDS